MSTIKNRSKIRSKRKNNKPNLPDGFNVLSDSTPFIFDFEQGTECRTEALNLPKNESEVFKVKFAPWTKEFFKPYRYKVAHGGRGGSKSWAFADMLINKALEKTTRIFCCREYQKNISESVHKLLSDRIEARGLDDYFQILDNEIRCKNNGSNFIYGGLRLNKAGIKSLEGVDIVWVEEAQTISEASLRILLPTIRKKDSEIWFSFNPGTVKDPVWQRFVEKTPDNALVIAVNYYDNPWFTEELEQERLNDEKNLAIEDYENIWLGKPYANVKAQIFVGRYEVLEFETKNTANLLFGADFGFGADPNTLIRVYVDNGSLYIDYEAYQLGLETADDLPRFYDTVPRSRKHMIRAENARPENIRKIRKSGFIIKPCKKWPGSVMDGIETMRQFNKIYIHPRCKHTIEEFENYSYKYDELTNEVQRGEPVDKYNHCIDAIRYALELYVLGKKRLKK